MGGVGGLLIGWGLRAMSDCCIVLTRLNRQTFYSQPETPASTPREQATLPLTEKREETPADKKVERKFGF